MKRIILIINLLVIFCMSGWAQAQITFDKKVHDFGAVLWKNPVTATFTITNSGDKPLVISNVTTSCGCRVANWTKAPIAPGTSGEVNSTFDSIKSTPNNIKLPNIYIWLRYLYYIICFKKSQEILYLLIIFYPLGLEHFYSF